VTDLRIERCPYCKSFHVVLELRPCNSYVKDGATTYFINVTQMRCESCLRVWDRKAMRGVGMTFPPPESRGFWDRLYNLIHPAKDGE